MRAWLLVLQRAAQAAHAQRARRRHVVPLLPDVSGRCCARWPQCLLACQPLRWSQQGGSASAKTQQAAHLQNTLCCRSSQGTPVLAESRRPWQRWRQRWLLSSFQTELHCSVCLLVHNRTALAG